MNLPVNQGNHQEICVTHFAELVEQIFWKESEDVILGRLYFIQHKWLLSVPSLIVDFEDLEFPKLLLMKIHQLTLSAI